jgi:uncharacterized membrane protein
MGYKISNRLIFILALYGLIISSYLLFTYLNHTPILCLNNGCELVRSSPYSKLIGIPMPAFGAAAYLSILALSFARAVTDTQIRSKLIKAIFALSLLGFAFSAYLTYLEAFKINAFCIWCVASAIIVTSILFVSFLEVRGLK